VVLITLEVLIITAIKYSANHAARYTHELLTIVATQSPIVKKSNADLAGFIIIPR